MANHCNAIFLKSKMVHIHTNVIWIGICYMYSRSNAHCHCTANIVLFPSCNKLYCSSKQKGHFQELWYLLVQASICCCPILLNFLSPSKGIDWTGDNFWERASFVIFSEPCKLKSTYRSPCAFYVTNKIVKPFMSLFIKCSYKSIVQLSKEDKTAGPVKWKRTMLMVIHW